MPKITGEQLVEVKAAVSLAAEAKGYPNDLWMPQLAGEVIDRVTGVSYHQHECGTLRNGLRWSKQRPARQDDRAPRPGPPSSA